MHTSQVGAEDQIPVIGSIIGARRQKRASGNRSAKSWPLRVSRRTLRFCRRREISLSFGATSSSRATGPRRIAANIAKLPEVLGKRLRTLRLYGISLSAPRYHLMAFSTARARGAGPPPPWFSVWLFCLAFLFGLIAGGERWCLATARRRLRRPSAERGSSGRRRRGAGPGVADVTVVADEADPTVRPLQSAR